jgi:hypothetical protein
VLYTTIAGSLPKPEWLAEPQRLWLPWRVAPERRARLASLIRIRGKRVYGAQFERERYGFTLAGRRVADATMDMFLAWFLPKHLRPLGRPFLLALLDEPLLDAFSYPHPSRGLRQAVSAQLRLRARAVSMLPERCRPKMRTAMLHRTYRRGYAVETLGPGCPQPDSNRRSQP